MPGGPWGPGGVHHSHPRPWRAAGSRPSLGCPGLPRGACRCDEADLPTSGGPADLRGTCPGWARPGGPALTERKQERKPEGRGAPGIHSGVPPARGALHGTCPTARASQHIKPCTRVKQGLICCEHGAASRWGRAVWLVGGTQWPSRPLTSPVKAAAGLRFPEGASRSGRGRAGVPAAGPDPSSWRSGWHELCACGHACAR